MPRGYRCIIVALVGWLSLATAQPGNRTSDPQPSANTDQSEALNGIASAIENAAKPGEHDAECPKGGERRSSDLCAQWYAADAANSAANAAWWVGIVGSLIGAATLIAAWKAATWAKVAAEETKRSADLASVASAADLRPYLFIEKLTMERSDTVFRPEIIFRNFGKLPARSITVKTDAFFTMDPVELRPDVLRSPSVAIPVCAPGHERRRFERVFLNKEEMKAFEAGFGYIVVRVRYRYKGGPRRGPYAERADYTYSAQSMKTGHFFILTWDSRRRASEERTMTFEFMDEDDDWPDEEEIQAEDKS